MSVLSRPVPHADHRIRYGPEASQFGDLWLPQTDPQRPFPVVAFFHGGWWKSEYDLGYAGHLSAALKEAGIATWSIEYRRIGDINGGWPATFQDAADGYDFLSTLATKYPLDLRRVITMGHSAGGLFAFWIAGRQRIPKESELYRAEWPPVVGAIALAGVVDLSLTMALCGDGAFAHDRDEIYRLMGGTPEELPRRYAASDPGELLPLIGTQVLIQGTRDDQIPSELPTQFARNAIAAGSEVIVKIIPEADHFDVVDPESDAWKLVLAQVQLLCSRQLRP